MKIKDVIKELKQYNQNKEVVYEVWTIEDIKQQAEDMGVKINKEQALNVLSELEENPDACQGINWDRIEYIINSVIES